MKANGLGSVPILTVCLPLRISIHRCSCFIDTVTVPVKPHRYFTRLKHRIHRVHLFRKPRNNGNQQENHEEHEGHKEKIQIKKNFMVFLNFMVKYFCKSR